MTRSDRTKARILAAAERLFARQGIEGTSLREIATAAGLSNNSSVQYHFGGKEELLKSLFNHRMLQMEERRVAMLRQAEKAGLLEDIRTLMSIICLPHLDIFDEEGRHAYAEFLAQYLLRYRPPMGPIADPPELPAPVALHRAQQLARARLAHLPEDVVFRRLVTGTLSFLTVLTNYRSFRREGEEDDGLDIALSDTLDQIAAAIALPFTGAGISLSPSP